MAEIHHLPGVFRADLEPKTDINNVLDSIRDAGMQDIVVIGRGLDGTMRVWTTQADADLAIATLYRGLTWLSETIQVHYDGQSA